MKETSAKRRDKAGSRDKADKSREAKGPKDAAPQDVEMPEEEAKQPRELDSLTLEGKRGAGARTGRRFAAAEPPSARHERRIRAASFSFMLADGEPRETWKIPRN